MAFIRKVDTPVPSSNNTGFGNNSSYNAGRFLKKDGTPNIRKTGIGILERYSIYHTMLSLPRWKFLSVILSFFIFINLLFATLYFSIGVEHLGGITQGSPLQNFGEAFFFSAQTFTTVGYGRINPSGFVTSAIAAIEALAGLLSFAVVTGLFYGRFSRPLAFLHFSGNMLVAPYKEISALMFRMVPYKNNQLSEVEVKVTAAMKVEENGKSFNRFYPLELEFAKVNALTLSWTVVHPIDEKSPLYGLTQHDMQNMNLEVLVYVKGFDEAFSNTVMARTSYTAEECIFGAKFRMMYEADKNNNSTILHIDRLDDIEEAVLPVREVAQTEVIA